MDVALDREPVVEMRGLSFAWPTRNAFRLIVDHFRVGRGERVLLVGPSGSGKSTLLGLICGSLVPDAGQILVLGEDLGAKPGPARDRFRAEHMGVIFQMFNLLPYLS